MHKYELAVVFNPTLTEEDLQTEFDKVQALITRFGGEVEKVDNWGKRRLAYEIKKLTEGFYYFITFNSNHDAPAEIESRLRITESLVRFLIIRVEEPRVSKVKGKPVAAKPVVEAEVTEPTVSNEEVTANE